MHLSSSMSTLLKEIHMLESDTVPHLLDVPLLKLGNSLIRLYYHTNNKVTRQRIADFLGKAGPVWTRKLLMADVKPIASTPTRFASLNDYVTLLAANSHTGFAKVG